MFDKLLFFGAGVAVGYYYAKNPKAQEDRISLQINDKKIINFSFKEFIQKFKS